MQSLRYPLMGLLVGASLLSACGSDVSSYAPGFSAISQSRGDSDPEAFVRHLSNGSKGMMRALAEMNQAVGRRQVAENLEAYLADAPDRWDASTFEGAWTEAEVANIPPGLTLDSAGPEAEPHIVDAWIFSSYSGYMSKLAYDDARGMVDERSFDPTMLTTIEAATRAVQVLPSQIEMAGTIATQTLAYMSERGIPRPGPQQIARTLGQVVGDTGAEGIAEIFG